MLQNIAANRFEFPLYLQVRIPQNRDPVLLHPCIYVPIGSNAVAHIMLRSVQFDHDLLRRDVEISDIVSENLLSVNRYGQGFQKIVPKMSFFFCHLAAHLL